MFFLTKLSISRPLCLQINCKMNKMPMHIIFLAQFSKCPFNVLCNIKKQRYELKYIFY